MVLHTYKCLKFHITSIYPSPLCLPVTPQTQLTRCAWGFTSPQSPQTLSACQLHPKHNSLDASAWGFTSPQPPPTLSACQLHPKHNLLDRCAHGFTSPQPPQTLSACQLHPKHNSPDVPEVSHHLNLPKPSLPASYTPNTTHQMCLSLDITGISPSI